MSNRRRDYFKFVQRLAHFMAGNIVTQGLTAVTGLFLVRWLSVEQYAIYTVATVTTGAITVLSKGGTNVGFVSLLGRRWPDYAAISPVVAALKQARRTLFVFLVPLVLLLAGYLLFKASVGWGTMLVILALLTVFWVGEMNSKTLDQVLYFAHQTTRVQILDASLAVGRFALTALFFLFGGLTAVTAMVATALMAVLRIVPIETWVYRIVPRPTAPAGKEELDTVMNGVRLQLPATGFFVLQGQLVLLLLSLHATTATIAGYGAMLRISALMAPVRTLNAAFFVPIAAKAKRHAGRTILLLACINSMPGLALIAIGAFFPSAILWLIGPQYAHLKGEVLVMVLTTAFVFSGGGLWTLVIHRGWVKFSNLQIPLGLLWAFGAGYILDLSTISGALVLNAGFTLPSLLLGFWEIYRHRADSEPEGVMESVAG